MGARCSSGSTVSTKARKRPVSIRRPISSSCVRLGSTMKNSPLIPCAFAFSADGVSTILTSVPPRFSRGSNCRREPRASPMEVRSQSTHRTLPISNARLHTHLKWADKLVRSWSTV
jgi:hypothetical protein